QTKPALGLTSVRGARAAALSSSVHPPANDLTYGLAKGAPAGECASAGRNWRLRVLRRWLWRPVQHPAGPCRAGSRCMTLTGPTGPRAPPPGLPAARAGPGAPFSPPPRPALSGPGTAILPVGVAAARREGPVPPLPLDQLALAAFRAPLAGRHRLGPLLVPPHVPAVRV